MLHGCFKIVTKILAAAALILLTISPDRAGAAQTFSRDRCEGYGALQSLLLTDWESGLGSWTAGTYGIINPATFDTDDWTTAGSLPDSRPGTAAFVADLIAGDCVLDDETGALTLDSPVILIPGGTQVPRVSVNHWFETDTRWDGGNIKVSVNGGAFTLIPAGAIELGSYNDTLHTRLDEFGNVFNSNPLADQPAFSGTVNDFPSGRWIQTRINLLGIADAGDNIRLRFDFGVDDCTTNPANAVGWYIDEVEIYSCAAEVPPSNCGNGVINGNEQCDDGNNFIGDGCSNTCDIESGWQCAAPTPSGNIADPGFEDGTPNASWTEVSNNFIGTPICRTSTCGTGGGTGPSDGTYWAWFGGTRQSNHESSVSQSTTFLSTATELTFDFEASRCDSASDYLEVLIDGNQELIIDGSSKLCGVVGYDSQSVNIRDYADGGTHNIEFHSETISANGNFSNFFVDSVEMPGSPSFCLPEGTSLTLVKRVLNDDGGNSYASEWTLTATGPTGFSGPGPVVMSGQGFVSGTYDLSESNGPVGYQAGEWDCIGGNQVDENTITLAPGEGVICTEINDDVVPTLAVVKNIINDSGGNIVDPDAFGLKLDGIEVMSNAANVVDIGDHTVSENGLPHYVPGTWGGDCNADGSISLSLGQAATCTISNDDISPTLAVLKTIINDDGGNITDENAFGLKIDGESVLHGAVNTVDAGFRLVSEDGLPGYLAGTWGGDCNANGSITLELEQDATCTITNNDVEATLWVVKNIINDNGGTVTDPNAFGLKVDGGAVLHDTPISIDAGNHTVSEDGLPGYQAGNWGGNCNPDGSITLVPGQNAVCSISNDDITPTLTVIKTIVNDSGGTVTNPNAFKLRIDGILVLDSIAKNLNVGGHTVSEDGLNGYQASIWGGDCNADGSISLALDQDATCTITNNDISPTLTVFKTILNDDEGVVTNPDNFGLRVDGTLVTHDTANVINAGVHTVSEDGLSGYIPGPWGGDCNPNGTVSLVLAQDATCSLTNDDVDSISLTLVKEVINDTGGTALPSDWTLTATGPSGFSGQGPSVSSGPFFAAGSYDLSESGGPAGYSSSNWVCVGGNQVDGDTITLEPGDVATCTISNNDRAPTLRLVKTIINDDGGTVTNPNAFVLRVNGFVVFQNAPNAFPVGSYVVSEDGLPGYQASEWGGDCDPDGSITLALDQDAVCTITNNDIAPTLRVVKTIINLDGGTITDPNAFNLKIDGISVQDNAVNELASGMHIVSETGLPGYQAGVWGGDCSADGSINLALGQNATCTITNDDNIVTSLVLAKSVNNDHGGTAVASAWILSADGLTSITGPGPLVSSGMGFEAGVYELSESGGQAGYGASTWVCVGGHQVDSDTITLEAGDAATCTITNDDIAPTLTLVKTIINNNGGTVSNENLFGLSIDGELAPHNVMNIVSSGSHIVSEAGLPGYQPGSWGGDCNPDGSITLALDQDATCTITNDDITPTLTVAKTVVNNNGGTVTDPDAFGLRVDGSVVLNNVTGAFDAGVHVLSEDGLTGYQAGTWGGDCNSDGSITLALDQDAICTLTNDDIEPGLTLVKELVNNNGGSAVPADWQLTATGPSSFSGAGPSISSGPGFDAGRYDLSESSGEEDYTASTWVCVGGTQNDADTITLALGESATCTITNDDDAPALTLVKEVNNENGGTAQPSAWTLTAVGPTGFSGAGPSVSSGEDFQASSYDLSESGGPDGYTASDWLCVGGSQDDGDTITLGIGETASCTITNDDISPTLTVVKTIINDNGGTITNEDAFGLKVDGGVVLHNATNSFDAGNHILSEDGLPGYQAGSWGGDCNPDGSITLALDQDATCTLTNDDANPGLTLVKEVINNSGGTELPSAWTLSATGPTSFSGPGPSVSNGDEMQVGTYDLSESGGPDGYTASDWVCVGGSQDDTDTITLALGDTATCTITNDDITPTLTVVKTIINDNGGTVTDENAFGLKVDGNPVLHNANNAFNAGNHTLSEDGLPGYQAGNWGGDCNTDGTITLALDQDASCTLTNDDIEPGLTLVNQVINNNGGSALPLEWALAAIGPTGFSGAGPTVSNGLSFDAGSYDLSLSGGPEGYSSSTWVCVGGTQDDSDTITLELGESATCTITNDDETPTLTLAKVVSNNNGGTAAPSAWTLTASGLTGFSGAGPSVSSGEDFQAGSYDLSESGGPDGYTASDWVCVGGSQDDGDTITLGIGETASCTITNDDITPTMTVVKTIINDNGGTITNEDAFGLKVDDGVVLHSATNSFDAGSHTLSEDGLPDYQAGSWGGDCNPDGSITLAIGQDATCTLSNDDIAPGLTLVKEVVNNSGGTELPSAWTLSATGPTSFSGPGPSVSNGDEMQVGTYDLSESGGPDGYTASDWVCVGGSQDDTDTITLALGDTATCTITNDDITPTLTVVKTIINDNGGTVTDENAFGLKVDGNPVLHNANNAFNAGNHTLSEDGLPGYQAGNWGGDCNTDGTITLALDQDASCTLTNDDIEPGLTLVKEVINNNGGSALPANWTLTATGPAGFSGAGPGISNGPDFQAGSYDLSESGGPDNYTASSWSCIGGIQEDADTIKLAPGDTAICTITNDDLGPGLTLIKDVVNNNGGTAQPSAWTLTATGPTSFSGAGPSISSGDDFEVGTYDLSESSGPGGYTASEWVCVGGNQDDADTITLALGEAAACTIRNDDDEPGLTLTKVVTSNNGGTALPSDWTLSAIGPSSFSGKGPSVSSSAGFEAGSYDLSESGGPDGYTASEWVCDGGTQVDADTITLALGESASCTISNDDAEPSLTLIKEVTNNNGGTALPAAWTLTAAGPTGFNGVGPSVSNGADFEAGSYDLSESGGPENYQASEWVCVGGTQIDGDTITLALGESATCTISNNDEGPGLTLVKNVTNNFDGPGQPSDWTLTAEGPTGFSGPGPIVANDEGFEAGTYDLSENDALEGYTASDWVCEGGIQIDADTITLALGEAATCTITNSDTGYDPTIFANGFE